MKIKPLKYVVYAHKKINYFISQYVDYVQGYNKDNNAEQQGYRRTIKMGENKWKAYVTIDCRVLFVECLEPLIVVTVLQLGGETPITRIAVDNKKRRMN